MSESIPTYCGIVVSLLFYESIVVYTICIKRLQKVSHPVSKRGNWLPNNQLCAGLKEGSIMVWI